MTQSAAFDTNLIASLSSWLAQTTVESTAKVRPGTEADAIDDLAPQVVVKPQRIEHISAALRFATMHRLAVAPVGGRTQTHWGGPAERVDMLLDLSAMDRVLDYQPADMTVTVQAGCTVTGLQARLAEHRQFLPVDPALSPQATVGGLVATNAAGPLRFAYGTVRDFLLGARFVRANGDIVQVGGRVVKNAAGFEIAKLLTGSLGTLGVLAELTFMVRPLPEEQRLLFIPVPHLDAIEPIVAILLDATLEPVLLELGNQAALRRFSGDLLLQEMQAPYGIFVGFMGSQTIVEWQVDHVRNLLAPSSSPLGIRLQVCELPWRPGYDFLVTARRAHAEALVCRASLLSSDIASFFDRAEHLFREQSLDVPLLAHAGSGVVHLHFDPVPNHAPDLINRLRALIDEAGPASLQMHGMGDLDLLRSLMAQNVVIESAPAKLRRAVSVWGRRAPHHDLAIQLKRRLDPDGLLNPGRLLGG